MRRTILITAGFLLLAGCNRPERGTQTATTAVSGGGDVAHGKLLVGKYACNSCHVVPGIEGPKGSVGPSLEHVARRPTIGGKLANTPQNVATWLQNPQAIDPDNTMPNLGVSPQESRDLAAFLATLR